MSRKRYIPVKHNCVMVYPDGHRETITRLPSQVNTWINANKQFNQDAALFVDGVCHYRGRIQEDRITQLAAELRPQETQP